MTADVASLKERLRLYLGGKILKDTLAALEYIEALEREIERQERVIASLRRGNTCLCE